MSDMQANSVCLPGRADRTDERASEFLVRRYDVGHWSDADQAELDAWLGESLANRASYWRLKAAWIRADRLDALRPMSPRGGPPSGQQRSQSRLKLAAAIGLLTLLGSTAWFASQPSTRTFSTAVGERSSLQLPDGSGVELTTNTVLRIATSDGTRKVWLDKGEAFFQVVHNDDRPFELQALGFRIVDLGTEFSIRRDANRIEVTVLKGSVRVEPPESRDRSRAVQLTAGEIAIADSHGISVSNKSAVEIEDALSWRTGFLVFRRTPLTEVAAEFNRYNNDKIVVDDVQASTLTVSARLPATDVNAFARMAHNFMGLRVSRSGDEIHISR
jgi:transmembrane sensor